jgi:hypothetical protein
VGWKSRVQTSIPGSWWIKGSNNLAEAEGASVSYFYLADFKRNYRPPTLRPAKGITDRWASPSLVLLQPDSAS